MKTPKFDTTKTYETQDMFYRWVLEQDGTFQTVLVRMKKVTAK